MRIVVLDNTAVVADGPGSPAYFSRETIKHLREEGHEIIVLAGFDPAACAAADLVWCEWTNEVAFEAAASGVCKNLILRMRGYDVWAPLDRLDWAAVSALVYESVTLRDLAEERYPGLKGIRTAVIPAGIDMERFAFKQRCAGPVIAMVSRALADKGHQLALEFARQNPQYTIHMTTALGDSNPRFVRYLQHAAPSNVVIHGTVDPAVWLNQIDANYFLCTSVWETLCYAIAEAMAMGIKPLIHDFPGAARNWPSEFIWSSFDDLKFLLGRPYESSRQFRAAVQHLDSRACTANFVQLIAEIVGKPRMVTKAPATPAASVAPALTLGQALAARDFSRAEGLVVQAATQLPREMWIPLALQLAAAYVDAEVHDKAAFFAGMAMRFGPRPDACAIAGEAALGEDEYEAALGWYRAAREAPMPTGLLAVPELVDDVSVRMAEIAQEIDPVFEPAPAPMFYVLVPVRNAERWIRKCLESIDAQTYTKLVCIVIDDASTDGTRAEIEKFMAREPKHGFIVLDRPERFWSLSNIVATIRKFGDNVIGDEDVIAIIDGDDWLWTDSAFDAVARAYQAGAWMTYGNFVTASGKPSWMGAYPYKVVAHNTYRKSMWRASHLKTFKRWLFDLVEDWSFKDNTGEWFHIAGDVALMVPMLEMAGPRAKYIAETIYVYNDETPDNDHKVDPTGQVAARDMIFARPPYPRRDSR